MMELKNNHETEPKVGVYVCHCGGNISNTVDVKRVVNASLELPGVVLARENLFVCSDPGQDLIIEDIKKGRINRVVVASCAPSLHEITFRNAILRAGLNPYLYVHANIREQVSFVHEGEEATEKATSLVAAAVARVRELHPLETTSVKVTDHATVIGGGVAGMKAALDLARRGLRVSLIEKSPFLGGRVARLNKLFPTGEKAEDILTWLTGSILENPNIDVFTCTEVIGQEGYIGNFTLTLKRSRPVADEDLENLNFALNFQKTGEEFIPFLGILPGKSPEELDEFELNTGAIVIATGFALYSPKHGEYGFNEHPEVITLTDLIRIMSENEAHRDYLEVGGRKIKSMAMIHCVGSRQIPGLHEPDDTGCLHENCSRTCCTGLLHTAVEIKERYPETDIFNVYRDIRTYGHGHEKIYLKASELGVRFIRFKVENPPSVMKNGDENYALTVSVKDSLLDDEVLDVPVDLVVLATGMLPGKIDNLIETLKVHPGADGFLLEVHPKLRPVEVFTPGIYLAGTCQAPMDITEATAAASAAASKVSIVLSRGEVTLEPFISSVDQDRCISCLTCVRTCPFEVPKIEESGAYINPAACYGCGACVAECPREAISIAHFDNKEIEAQVKGAIGGQT